MLYPISRMMEVAAGSGELALSYYAKAAGHFQKSKKGSGPNEKAFYSPHENYFMPSLAPYGEMKF